MTPIDWKGTWTLDDYIIDLFKKGKTESQEFQTMLMIFGREKMEKIWHKHREKIKAQECRIHIGDCGCY